MNSYAVSYIVTGELGDSFVKDIITASSVGEAKRQLDEIPNLKRIQSVNLLPKDSAKDVKL